MQREENPALRGEGCQGNAHIQPLVPDHRLEEISGELRVGGVGALGQGLPSLVHTALQLQGVIPGEQAVVQKFSSDSRCLPINYIACNRTE